MRESEMSKVSIDAEPISEEPKSVTEGTKLNLDPIMTLDHIIGFNG